MAFKGPVSWRGEGRSQFGGASGGEDMGTTITKGGT